MKKNAQLNEYFSDKELIKVLCKKRIKIAKQGHDAHFLRNISPLAKDPQTHTKKIVFSFFPSRATWLRLKKKERENLGLNTTDINSLQLQRTVFKQIKDCKKLGISYPCWLNQLLCFIEEIRELIFNETLLYEISAPKTTPILKDKIDNTYRPLSVYDLKDHIIIGQIARYLSNSFDQLFYDCSYAFRTGVKSNKIFNHHTAIEDIINFKNQMGRQLYVSECDIKKFYDCVNHKVIVNEFNSIVIEAEKVLNIKVHTRAIFFFYSYLRSFSFNHSIKNVEATILSRFGISGGKIPWVKESELLAVNSDPINDNIGVPQGGAISCLIANILLNHVDRTMISYADQDTFYGRFCDDMVLIHSNQSDCQLLLDIYQIALKEVKLISHSPLGNINYGKDFWDDNLKSKLPYKWGVYNRSLQETHKNVPWLAFVGYQVKFDGTVRVRKKSIANELKKQVAQTDEIIDVIRKAKKPRLDKNAIKFRLQQRLISMSISRFRFGVSNISMCWCAGFKILRNRNNLTNQIRKLDRNRERQIKRLELYLNDIKTPVKLAKKKIVPLRYYGYNYSYYKQFDKHLHLKNK